VDVAATAQRYVTGWARARLGLLSARDGDVHLTLIRHAESVWNATNRWQGQTDVELSPRGRLQVRSLAKRWFGHEVDHAYASDLIRASETAAALGVPYTVDPQYREIDVGEWASLTRAEVAVEFAEQVAALRAGEPVRIGGGESMDEFEARVDTAIDALREAHAGERVLLVTHGGVIRALCTRALAVRGQRSPLVGVTNTAITEVSDDVGRPRIVRYNAATHLEAVDQDSAMFRAVQYRLRVAVVAADPDGPADRALVDALLGGLQIARYLAPEDAIGAPLAEQLLADPLPAGGLDALRDDHAGESYAVVARPEAIPGLIATALGLGQPTALGLAVPAHGAVAQLLLYEDHTELWSYGISLNR